jgi:hypothetical protein
VARIKERGDRLPQGAQSRKGRIQHIAWAMNDPASHATRLRDRHPANTCRVSP